jgi:hypothetical protein
MVAMHASPTAVVVVGVMVVEVVVVVAVPLQTMNLVLQ